MTFELYTDVILVKDIPEDKLQAGDIGCVVDIHEVQGMETSYSVEFFDLLGNRVALITVPSSCLRNPTNLDRPSVRRELAISY